VPILCILINVNQGFFLFKITKTKLIWVNESQRGKRCAIKFLTNRIVTPFDEYSDLFITPNDLDGVQSILHKIEKCLFVNINSIKNFMTRFGDSGDFTTVLASCVCCPFVKSNIK